MSTPQEPERTSDTPRTPAEPERRAPGAGEDATRVVPASSSEQPTTAVPAQGGRRTAPSEPVPGTYWQAGDEEAPVVDPLPRSEPQVFPEAVLQEPPSRAGAHLWALLISLALAPVAWFLIEDGGARIYWSLRSDVADINIAGLAGLGAGLLVTFLILLAARWSSLGAFVAGIIGFAFGAAFLALPGDAFDLLGQGEEFLLQFGGFGENVYAYAVESALRGHFVVAGLVLIMVGVVSHGARRKGRREEFARIAVRAARGENPFR